MPAKKLPDKKVEMMIRRGMRPVEIVQRLLDEDNIEVTPEAISAWRRRRGIEPWVERYDDLLPWRIAKEHVALYPAKMLRLEAARRRGKPLPAEMIPRLDAWIKNREDEDTVVHYERELAPYFFYVPRREKDTDLIRVPDQPARRAAAGR